MTGSVSKAGTILPPKFYLQYFATIWYLIRWLQFWPLALKANVATSWKFGHQVQNLVIRWRHLHWFQCCPPGWVTCIATLPGIALLTLSVGIDLVSSSARVTSVKFQKFVLHFNVQMTGSVSKAGTILPPKFCNHMVPHPLVTILATCTEGEFGH